MHRKVHLIYGTSESDVQGLGMFLYCLLTLQLLVYWEAISRMTTMTTVLITARPPAGFP